MSKAPIEKQFTEIIGLIQHAKFKAMRSVNSQLVELYWQIGKYISQKVASAEWGMKVVDELADFLKEKQPELKGFGRRNLYKMMQFYETYQGGEIVSTVLTQLAWSNHLHILSKTKTIQEKEFYIRLCTKERYTARELARQIDSGYYERTMLSCKKVPTLSAQIPKALSEDLSSIFKDTYVLDFLNLPENHSEKDLQQAIVLNFKRFILEFGRDFTFIGQEVRLSVGAKDFFIDLLFFHRDLQCLVAFELKIDDFKPEHVGQMDFYLEALDRDFKKPHENPSVGIILCKSKDSEVVEYAMSRSLSPSLVAEYQTKLIDKDILANKLHEFFELSC